MVVPRMSMIQIVMVTFSTVGCRTINYIDKYNFDKAFIGVNGISIEEGFTTQNELEA